MLLCMVATDGSSLSLNSSRARPQASNARHFFCLYEHADSRKVSLCEWTDGKWVLNGDYTSAVSWPSYLPKPGGNFVQQLSKGTLAYDCAAQDGYRNFSGWVATAAADAGR